MPELPEVETVRRGLVPFVKNARIKKVELRRANLRNAFSKDFTASLEGATIKNLRRRAKYILADLTTAQGNEMVWLTHLGMTGSFTALDSAKGFKPGTHDHVIITFEGGKTLVFNDPRRFGQMSVHQKTLENTVPGLKDLGPEPLEDAFDGKILLERLKGRKTPIKVALLDQSLVAGIGNIYASEALFLARIDPRRPANTVTKAESGKLAQAIKDVLNASLESGGSTLRNYRNVDGNTGQFQHRFNVYDHDGERCPNCTCAGKSLIQIITQAGRSTFFCPVKQR